MIRRTGNLLWRTCRVVGGMLLLLVGLFLSLPGIPGPGIVIIVLGLGILSSEFDWAERLYTRLKKMGQSLIQRNNSPKPPSPKAEEDNYFAQTDRELPEKLRKKRGLA